MNFEIQSKDEDGNIVFSGTANAMQASFLLTVGINTLLASGAMPILTGETDSDVPVADTPTTVQ